MKTSVAERRMKYQQFPVREKTSVETAAESVHALFSVARRALTDDNVDVLTDNCVSLSVRFSTDVIVLRTTFISELERNFKKRHPHF